MHGYIILREVLNVVAVAFIQKQNGDILMPAGFVFIRMEVQNTGVLFAV